MCSRQSVDEVASDVAKKIDIASLYTERSKDHWAKNQWAYAVLLSVLRNGSPFVAFFSTEEFDKFEMIAYLCYTLSDLSNYCATAVPQSLLRSHLGKQNGARMLPDYHGKLNLWNIRHLVCRVMQRDHPPQRARKYARKHNVFLLDALEGTHIFVWL